MVVALSVAARALSFGARNAAAQAITNVTPVADTSKELPTQLQARIAEAQALMKESEEKLRQLLDGLGNQRRCGRCDLPSSAAVTSRS